jgi:hypothetical protein
MVGVGKFEEPPTRLAPTDDTIVSTFMRARTHTQHTHTRKKENTRKREREGARVLLNSFPRATGLPHGNKLVVE